ncbi:MAG: hypothetical protein HC896_05015, partial [Bacteroidales bacterium]|nr:hypothetical protein [Bacteroidales bacterium]
MIMVLLMNSIYVLAQHEKEIIIAIKKAPDKAVEDSIIILLKNGNSNIKILDLKRNIEDFRYLGNFLLRDNKYLSLFSEYSSPAGLTKYYYFDFDNLLLYQSDFLMKLNFPQLFSLNIENSTYILCQLWSRMWEILSKNVL